MKLIDLSGMKFGRLTVIERDGPPVKGVKPHWIVVCECGTRKTVRGSMLGRTTSCGCKGIKHRMHKHPSYKSWDAMIQRCTNPKNPRFKDYGGRGITVCLEWRDFREFYRSMGARPKGTSIDRIDPNKGYEPGNCRWATAKEQMRNRRVSRVLTVAGESYCVSEWAERTGLGEKKIRGRLDRGWTPERALKTA